MCQRFLNFRRKIRFSLKYFNSLLERNSLTSQIVTTTRYFQIMSTKKPLFLKDHKQTRSLVEAGEKAASIAVRHAKALDLTITYIADGAVYEEHPDGTVQLKKAVQKKGSPIVLAKGMVLHAK
jgi:hypothetical protein